MPYDFDQIIDRRGTNSAKWEKYEEDVLPLWVADMDFRTPEPILGALHRKIEQGVLGYELAAPPALLEAICARLMRLYGWRVEPGHIVATPGLVSGFSLAARAVCRPGDGLLMQTPVYHPFLHIPEHQGLLRQTADLTLVTHGTTLHYEIDPAAFEAAITPQTRLFLLCHPHNPIGQTYTRGQLAGLAEICRRHDLVICSDEIHSELLLGGAQHVPLAVAAPEAADRLITLVAASKTFNVAGLFCGFAIIPNDNLRQRYTAATTSVIAHPNSLGLAAAQAAFTECDDWLAELRAYLTANRDALVRFVAERLPGVRTTVPDATYLAWLDFRGLDLRGHPSPFEFFLKEARVALNDGAEFGPGGEGFVRLNFGCPRSLLMEALRRMALSVEGHQP